MTNIAVFVIIKKTCFCCGWHQWDSRRVKRELQKGGGAPAGSQGALGNVYKVHWGPFLEVLDLQNVVRALNFSQILYDFL